MEVAMLKDKCRPPRYFCLQATWIKLSGCKCMGRGCPAFLKERYTYVGNNIANAPYFLLPATHSAHILWLRFHKFQGQENRLSTLLQHAQAEVQCSIVGSSIALLTGQKPPFRLLARAVRGSTGERLPHIKPAVSDAFVVATQRVKTAQKVTHPPLHCF